jgi:hypothetical protein
VVPLVHPAERPFDRNCALISFVEAGGGTFSNLDRSAGSVPSCTRFLSPDIYAAARCTDRAKPRDCGRYLSARFPVCLCFCICLCLDLCMCLFVFCLPACVCPHVLLCFCVCVCISACFLFVRLCMSECAFMFLCLLVYICVFLFVRLCVFVCVSLFVCQ